MRCTVLSRKQRINSRKQLKLNPTAAHAYCCQQCEPTCTHLLLQQADPLAVQSLLSGQVSQVSTLERNLNRVVDLSLSLETHSLWESVQE